jgi:hypothetical protein
VVSVDGEIRLETGPRLGLRVEGLQVANPESTRSPELLVAELAALRIEPARAGRSRVRILGTSIIDALRDYVPI